MKKMLFIVEPYFLKKKDDPLSYRYSQFLLYFKSKCSVDFINYIFFPYNNLFFRRIYFFIILKTTLIEVLYKLFIIIKFKLCKKKYDVIFISIAGLRFISLPNFLRKIGYKGKIIVDLCDPITRNILFDTFLEKKQQKLICLENRMVDSLDLLIVLNKEIEDYYVKEFNFKNVVIIEQGINLDVVGNLKYKKRNSQINLLYAGILYKDFREAFALYDAVEDREDKFVLNIYGTFLKTLYPSKKLCFKIYNTQPISKLPCIYSDSDVVVFIDNKDTVQVPGKTLEVLATNKPILFIYYNEDSPTLKYIKNFSGVYFTKNEKDNIVKVLDRILSDNIIYFERNLEQYYWGNLMKRLDSNIVFK